MNVWPHLPKDFCSAQVKHRSGETSSQEPKPGEGFWPALQTKVGADGGRLTTGGGELTTAGGGEGRGETTGRTIGGEGGGGGGGHGQGTAET